MGATLEQLMTWDQVDASIKRLGELEITLANIEGDITLKINDLKEAAKDQAKPFTEEAAALSKQIAAFCELNKAEFSTVRSKDLVFGKVAYRIVKSVSIPRGKEKLEALIKSIKSFGFTKCIKLKEDVDKDALAELDDAELVKLGVTRTIKDSLRIEPNIEKIREKM